MFRDAVADFVRKHCSREYARHCDMKREYPYEAYAKMAEQGWFGLTLPEEEGGMGVDLLFRVILQEELARNAFDLGAVYGLTVWGIDVLRLFGSDLQKRRYIRPALEGHIRFSVSMTEPNAGSDLSGIELKAVDCGDHFLLNGQKLFASAAGAKNNVILLVARTSRDGDSRREGLTLFLVPNTLEGLEMRKLDTLSRKMSGTYECFYTDVRVPKENVVGEVGGAWEILNEFLIHERVGGAAMYVGNAATAVGDALHYATERRQFGKSIASFQAIKHALSDAATEIEAARLLTYQAAWMANQGLPCMKQAAMAKLYASEAGMRATTLGMQILGG